MSKTIALVDDDRNILTSLSIALEREGFKVQTYIDGESALVGLSRNPPDLAEVKELQKAFLNNEDIHALTASQVFNVPIKKVDENLRRKAKTINFGIIYGITQYGLAKQISVSNEDAQEFINAYFKKFPEIKDYMEKTIKFCR